MIIPESNCTTKYTVTSKGCGLGKTTQDVYPYIDRLLKADEFALIVVPSVALQHQYKERFPTLTMINSFECSEKVVQSLINAVKESKQLICITQQCFFALYYSPLLQRYNLIDDDVTDIGLLKILISIKSNKFVQYNWSTHFKLTDPDTYFTSNTEYKQLDIIGHSDDLIAQSSTYRNLTDPKFDYYIRQQSYENMMGEQITKDVAVCRHLNPTVFTWFKSVFIAAANFEKTPLHKMLSNAGVEFNFISKFEKHNINATLHLPDNYKASKTTIDNDPEIIKSLHWYINAIRSHGHIISLRNTSVHEELPDEYKMNHNCHGMNKHEYMACVNMSMESALIYDYDMQSFIKQIILYDMDDDLQDRYIKHYTSAYLFYQTIMRGAFRTGKPTAKGHVVVLDSMAGVELMEYFNFIDVVFFKISRTKERPIPMTNAECCKRHRAKKQPTKVKSTPMTSTERSRLHREKKKQDATKNNSKSLISHFDLIYMGNSCCFSLHPSKEKEVEIVDLAMSANEWHKSTISGEWSSPIHATDVIQNE